MSVISRLRNGSPVGHAPRVPFTINPHSPQARGLTNWFVPQYIKGSSVGVCDLVGTSDLISVTNTPDRVATPFGVPGVDCVTNERIYSTGQVSHVFPITLTMWGKVNTDGTDKYLFDLSSSTTNLCNINLDAGPNIRAYRRVSSYGISGSISITLGKWYLFAGVFTDNLSRAWISGITTTDDTTALTASTMNDVNIGARNNGQNNADVTFIDARIYNRALTNDELWQMYAPRTRWDLYQPISGAAYKAPAAAGSVVPQFYHQRFHNRAA